MLKKAVLMVCPSYFRRVKSLIVYVTVTSVHLGANGVAAAKTLAVLTRMVESFMVLIEVEVGDC